MSGNLLWVGAIDGDPEYQSKVLRHLMAPFAGVAASTRLFGAISGVRPGVDSSIITVTSTTWTVGAHPGVIDELDAADSGLYVYEFAEDQTGDVTAADSSNARVDRLDVQIVAGDGATTTDSVAVVYTEGVASANPVAPTAPDNSFPLITISVPKVGGGSPTFTWTAPQFGPNIPMVSVYPANEQSVPNGATDVMFMGGKDIDTHGAWTGSDLFTAPVAGIYRYTYNLGFPGNLTSGFLHLVLLKNGAEWVKRTAPYSQNIISASGLIDLAKGDTLGPSVYQSSGAAINMPGNTTASWLRPSSFEIEWVRPSA